MGLMEWRSVLAGPIVRRVETSAASVWVAIDESAEVTLRVWEGLESAGTTRDPAFLGRRRTRRLGDNLHVVVVTAPGTYLPGLIYSYDLEFDTGGEPQNLDRLQLLADGTVNGKPHRALGYEPAMLPSFTTCPPEITDLRLLHASCRLPDTELQDGMVWIDDLIGDARTSAFDRPHQLMLSGDQIYSDEAGALLLALVSDAGNTAIGMRRDTTDELVPKEELRFDGKLWPCDRHHFPPGWRRNITVEEARLTSIEADSHVFSFSEFCGYYLLVWSNTMWPESFPPQGSFLPGPPPVRGRPSKIESPPGDFAQKLEEKYTKWETALKRFRDGLPFVRRALANVATYMILDDHDVTDDWNLNELWRSRVYQTEFGRTILRNGITSYAMFQGWGNDPALFETGGANRELLDRIEQLCPESDETYPNAEAVREIEKLVGLTQAEPQVQWHYRIDGSRHRLVVLDNRTQRSFTGKVTPPQNIMPTRLEDQIPEGPLPAGFDVLVLVAPLPVFGPPVIDELLGSLAYKIADLHTYFKERNVANTNMPATFPDAVEGWSYSPEAFEALLNWLEPYKRVVILSGDLHYSSAQAMTFWKGLPPNPPPTPEPPARYAQLICSAVKTNFSPTAINVSRVIGFAQKIYRAKIGIERLAYRDVEPSPVTLPAGETIPRALRRRLKARPVLLPTDGWPEGTREARPFDWAWRVEIVRDKRPDSERPEFARDVPYIPSDPEQDVAEDIEGYRRVAARQIRQLDHKNFTRQILFANSIAILRFSREAEGLTVRQELLAVHPLSPTPDRPEVHVIHSVLLDGSPTEEPPRLEDVQ
jgi:hypothetical protein